MIQFGPAVKKEKEKKKRSAGEQKDLGSILRFGSPFSSKGCGLWTTVLRDFAPNDE